MKLHFNNEKGLTLVELLATIVIISILVVLIFGILLNAQNTYNRQSTKNQEISNLAYQLKVFTKDIRRATDVTSLDNCSSFTINGTELLYDDDTNQIIYKSGGVYLNHVENFSCTMTGSFVNMIDITLKTQKSEVSTKIIVRREK